MGPLVEVRGASFRLVRGRGDALSDVLASELARAITRDRMLAASVRRMVLADSAARASEDELRAAIVRALRVGALGAERVRSTLTAPPIEKKTAEHELESIAIHWIEIELVGMDNAPIGGVRYVIKDPDGRTHRGTLDVDGRARVSNVRSPGMCEITFPDLDKGAWR